MKIKVFEEICKNFGGSYEYSISEDNRFMFLTLRTGKHALFPDELNKIKRKAKRIGFRIQYISYENDGIGLEFVKH